MLGVEEDHSYAVAFAAGEMKEEACLDSQACRGQLTKNSGVSSALIPTLGHSSAAGYSMGDRRVCADDQSTQEQPLEHGM